MLTLQIRALADERPHFGYFGCRSCCAARVPINAKWVRRLYRLDGSQLLIKEIAHASFASSRNLAVSHVNELARGSIQKQGDVRLEVSLSGVSVHLQQLGSFSLLLECLRTCLAEVPQLERDARRVRERCGRDC